MAKSNLQRKVTQKGRDPKMAKFGRKQKGKKFSSLSSINKEENKDTHSAPKTKKSRKKHSTQNKPEENCHFEEVTQNTKSQADGFLDLDTDSDTNLQEDAQQMIRKQNRKNKKSGGFQTMGLSYPVFKGIMRKGYKVPTPIQRKTIPLILDGKDVVAMARTGSGKTAAFLIPMFERLKTHQSSGVRAIIMSPTRELALQTLKFTKELGRYSGLKSAVILGGDSMEDQFAAIHENPDIIIATPGRFMHVLVEMEMKLQSVEYVVFDEADRLFELGFQEQLREILQRLPETRQTLLFSATLPKLLVEFAKAGLSDPTLIRLDVDTKLSENLRLAFLQCRSDDKLPILLHFLRNIIKPSEQTVIFTATKHHVEYLNMVLTQAGFSCSYCYSALDPTARKINVAKFRSRKTLILLVTDLAARGIDIPLLDNVINYNFPAKSKLFLHRVGRVARAGSSGTAYSFVSPDELPYVLDLHLFLGRPLKLALVGKEYADKDGLLGRVPQSIIDSEEEVIRHWKDDHDILAMEKVVSNAYRHYFQSRPHASAESVRRMREFNNLKLAYHPMFESQSLHLDQLLESMRSFKPRGTIFEVNASKKTSAFYVMKKKRGLHESVIFRNTLLSKDKSKSGFLAEDNGKCSDVTSDDNNFSDAFSHVIESTKKKQKPIIRDEENYLNYRPKDFNSEQGLNIASNFEKVAADVTLDITGDDELEIRKQHSQLKWDRKRKRYIAETGMELKKKKVKTESGQWIPATYKTNVYKDWLERSKIRERMDDEEASDEDEQNKKGRHKKRNLAKMEVLGTKKAKGGFPSGKLPPAMEKRYKGGTKELKRKEQIIKERNKKEALRHFMKQKQRQKQRKR